MSDEKPQLWRRKAGMPVEATQVRRPVGGQPKWIVHEQFGEQEHVVIRHSRFLELYEPVPDFEATPWPPRDVVVRLVRFARRMLNERDYDDHGWEELQQACEVAEQWVDQTGKTR